MARYQPDNGCGKLCEECRLISKCHHIPYVTGVRQWQHMGKRIVKYSSSGTDDPFIEICHSYEPKDNNSTPPPIIGAVTTFVEKEPISESDTLIILSDWISTRYPERLSLHRPGQVLLITRPIIPHYTKDPIITYLIEERGTPLLKILITVSLRRISMADYYTYAPILKTIDLHDPNSFDQLAEVLDEEFMTDALAEAEGFGYDTTHY